MPRTRSPFASRNATGDESLIAERITVALSTVHCR
jgi:hypothetical protein